MTQQPDLPPYSPLKQAVQYLREGKRAEAQKVLADYLKSSPTSADGWFLASLTFDDEENKVKALRRALEADPQHRRARRALTQLRPGQILEQMLDQPVKRQVPREERTRRGLLLPFAVAMIMVLAVLGVIFGATAHGRDLLIAIGILPTSTHTATATEPPVPTGTARPTQTVTPSPEATATQTLASTPAPSSTPRPTPTSRPTLTPAVERGDRQLPARIGERLWLVRGSNMEFDVEVVEVLRGERVSNFIQSLNMFNPVPRPGREYALILVMVAYLSGPPSAALRIREDEFKIISRNSILDEFTLITGLDQLSFEANLLPGGVAAGVLVRQVYEDDPHPLLVFGMNRDGSGGFYFSLSQYLPGYVRPRVLDTLLR